MDSNINENIKKETKERRNYLFSLVSVLTLVVAIIGATYAYFQLTASNNNINGAAAELSLGLEIEKIAPAGSNENEEIDGLTPLLDEEINTKVNTTVDKICNEGSSKVCQIYEMKLTNTGNATITLWGTISFQFKDEFDNVTTNTMPNLKFSADDGQLKANYSEDKSLLSIESASFSSVREALEDTTPISNTYVTISPGGTTTVYLAVWITEKNALQYDKGRYTATVTYSSVGPDGSETQGVTSTITA